MKSYYFILFILFFSCKNDSIELNEVSKPVENVVQKLMYQKPNFSREPKSSNMTVSQIFERIDNIYSIDKTDKSFNHKTININTIEHRYGITSFDTSGALRLYSHGNFGLLEYINENYSTFAFRKIFDVITKYNTDYQNNHSQQTDEGISLEHDVINKSGIVYILKDNYIMYKLRRCNDDWRKNEKLEQSLLDKLFQSKPPPGKYLIRACCSCPAGKNMDLQ